MSDLQEPQSVIETRLTHDMHRHATSLLAEAAARPSADWAALGELRDFLVATLHHHHESEDRALWPLIAATAPGVASQLGDLSAEHDQLDASLDQPPLHGHRYHPAVAAPFGGVRVCSPARIGYSS